MLTENTPSDAERLPSHLRQVAHTLSEISNSLMTISSSQELLGCAPERAPTASRRPLSDAPHIQDSIQSLCTLIEERGLLGTHLTSTSPSITVSGIVAVGLEAVGRHREATRLVGHINEQQITSGQDRGAFAAPLPGGGYRPLHNVGNFWGLYSNLLVNPSSVRRDVVERAVCFFLDRQKEGAWALSNRHRPKAYHTACILTLLLEVYELHPSATERFPSLVKAVENAVRYLCNLGDTRRLIWSESEPLGESQDFHLPTTLIVIRALEAYQSLFNKTLYASDAIQVAYHSQIKPVLENLVELESIDKWPIVYENEPPTFQSWFSIPEVATVLIALGVNPLDSAIVEVLGWIESHLTKEDGFTGMSAGLPWPGGIVNWLTGHGLIAIGTWEKAVFASDFPDGLVANLLSSDSFVRSLNSSEYVRNLRALEQIKSYWKRMAVIAIMTSTILGAAFIINLLVQNLVLLNQQWILFASYVRSVVSNNIVNFVIGLLGLLPALINALVWLVNRLRRAKGVSN